MADPREITATLVVGFGADSASNNDALVAEIDSREDGLNVGKSSFLPGEDVWILVYASKNVVLNEPVTSWGDLIFRAGDELVEKEQDIQFVDSIEGRVTYPIQDGFVSTWIGRTADPVLQTGEMTLQIPEPPEDHYARLLRVNHTARARAYRLTNTLIPGFDEYGIIVHFTGLAE
jgi:hypothetical protein